MGSQSAKANLHSPTNSQQTHPSNVQVVTQESAQSIRSHRPSNLKRGEEGTVQQEPNAFICDMLSTSEEFPTNLDFFDAAHRDTVEIKVNKITDADSQLPYIQLRTPTGGKLIALVDSGAQATVISTAAAERLGLQVLGERMTSYSGFVSETGPSWIKFYKLDVIDLHGKSWTTVVPSFFKMNTKFRAPNHTKDDVSYLEWSDLWIDGINNLQEFDGRPVDLILGNNILNKIRRLQRPKMVFLPSGRAIENVTIGYIHHPPVSDDSLVPIGEDVHVNIVEHTEQIWVHTIQTEDYDLQIQLPTDQSKVSGKKLDKQVEQNWNLELLGMEPPEVVESKDKLNQQLINEFKESSTMDDEGRIHVALPWNGRQKELQTNLAVAKRRLASLLEKQLSKMSDREAYDDIIRQQEASGIIEKAPKDSRAMREGTFSPHRVVIKEDSLTTKLRIVHDASAHTKDGPSLNQCVYPGPSILQPILGILLRSRLSKYLLVADIEKAFHQIRIKEEFRDYTKFLWLKDPKLGYTEDNIEVFRFTRLPFGVSCSPFLLAVTILRYLELDPKQFNQRILENLYVDNLMFTSDSKEDLIQCYHQSKACFNKMAMNLREYITDAEEVMNVIEEKDKAPKEEVKLLGLMWNSKTNSITIKLATPPKGIPTKREVVAFNAQNYDPAGLIAPLVVRLKQFISSLWQEDIKWSDTIPLKMVQEWNDIVAQFTDTKYTIPRRITTRDNYKEVQMIVFSDASKNHYATATYLRYTFGSNDYSTGLIHSKSRVRPSSSGPEFTIPKMELMSFEIGTNAAVNLAKELHIDIKNVCFFSDSMICLYWILNRGYNSVGGVFINNRVRKSRNNLAELQSKGLSPTIRYVPSEKNPADIASRGCSLEELKDSVLWQQGPDFLRQDEDKWPKKLEESMVDPHSFREYADSLGLLPEEFPVHEECELGISTVIETEEWKTIVPYMRFNQLSKLVNTMAKVMEWICIITKKRNGRHPKQPITFTGKFKAYWTAFEAREAEEKLIQAKRYILRDHYRDAEERLNEKIPNRLSKAFHDDGTWRFQTRFFNADDVRLTPEMKLPVIIISKHPLAKLIVRESHMKLKHQGVNDMICDVQQRYWIEGINRLVKEVRAGCFICRKKHALPFKYEFSRILPQSRTTVAAPFQNIGLDYFGPLYYKSGIGREKMWVLLVTCLFSRAVHLEVVADNTTTSFIMAFSRFISRRGTPRFIVSDNAPTFKLGYALINEDLRTIVNQSETLTSFLAKHEIKIKLITPLSPWQGGIYERMVGLVKTLIFKVLGRQTKAFLEMETLLIEAEGIINSRPITPNRKDEDDTPAIRPVDFINPKACLALPEKCDTVFDVIKTGDTANFSRQLLETLGRVKQELWEEFSKRYFQFLREFNPKQPGHSKIKPKEGQIVLVDDKAEKSKFHWPLGRIVSVTREKDGIPRSVKVKCGKRIVEKSVSQLIPMEDLSILEEGLGRAESASLSPNSGEKVSLSPDGVIPIQGGSKDDTNDSNGQIQRKEGGIQTTEGPAGNSEDPTTGKRPRGRPRKACTTGDAVQKLPIKVKEPSKRTRSFLPRAAKTDSQDIHCERLKEDGLSTAQSTKTVCFYSP